MTTQAPNKRISNILRSNLTTAIDVWTSNPSDLTGVTLTIEYANGSTILFNGSYSGKAPSLRSIANITLDNGRECFNYYGSTGKYTPNNRLA